MASDDRFAVQPHRSEVASTALADLTGFERSSGARYAEFVAMAALSAIPWVGSVAAARQALRSETMSDSERRILTLWLNSHEERAGLLERDVNWLIRRVDQLGQEAMERAESPEFLALVRKAFSGWEQAETDEKRSYYSKLLANHAGRPLTSDAVARLFVEWIGRYHESHFSIIAFVANHPACAKRDIGVHLFGSHLPQDASAEAGLFRELYRELNMGGLVRGVRQIQNGSFLRKPRARAGPKGPVSQFVDTSFDDEDELELTELGRQFVHYVLTGAVEEIGSG